MRALARSEAQHKEPVESHWRSRQGDLTENEPWRMLSRSDCGGNDGNERAPSGRKKAGLDLQADVLRLQSGTAGSDAAASSSLLRQMGIAGPEQGGRQRDNLVRRLQLGDSRHGPLGVARSGIAARFAHPLAAQLAANLVSAKRNGRIEMQVTSCVVYRRRLTECTSREARHQCQQENERVRKKVHSTSGSASQARSRSGKTAPYGSGPDN